jgi:hypothetical protein
MSEIPKSDEAIGLVISSITVREASDNSELESIEEKEQEEIRAIKSPVISALKQKVIEASEKFPQVEKRSNKDTLSDYYIELTPGSIQFSRKLYPLPKSKKYVERQAITQWSYKSRANMLKRLLSLDYSPMFGDENRTPVMITLTYPGEWQSVAPEGKSAKRHISLLKKRYEREFGEPLIGVWKLEFQRRGAPHTHILSSITMDLGLFQVWLSKAWAEIVAHPDPTEREKHLRAGTQAKAWPDYYKESPHSISRYFGKHSSANRDGVKEYQNRAPELWVHSGSIGRFWGYWGLVPATAQALISKEDYLFMQRTLRRWHNSKGTFRKKKVLRSKSKDGVIYFRKANRRVERLTHQGGFIPVPDGMAETLLKALNAHKGTELKKPDKLPSAEQIGVIEPLFLESIEETPQATTLSARFKAVIRRLLKTSFRFVCRLFGLS